MERIVSPLFRDKIVTKTLVAPARKPRIIQRMKIAFAEFPEACELSLELPPIGEMVLIIGPDYKTVGYLDEQRAWRQHFDGKRLEGVEDWFPLR